MGVSGIPIALCFYLCVTINNGCEIEIDGLRRHLHWDLAELNNHLDKVQATVDKAGVSTALVIKQIEQAADRWKISLAAGSESGVLDVTTKGSGLRAYSDGTLARLFSGGWLTISGLGVTLSARVPQVHESVGVTLFKLPNVAGHVAGGTARNAMFAFWESFGYSAQRNLINQIENTDQRDLWVLLEYVCSQRVSGTLPANDKAELYRTLLFHVNDARFSREDRDRMFFVIGYVAQYDAELPESTKEFVMSAIPSSQIEAMLRKNDAASMKEIMPTLRTLAVRAVEISSDTSDVGTVVAFPSEQVPNGYLVCNGAEYAQSEYPELFLVLSPRYGTSVKGASIYFRVPDYRGLFLRGLDQGAERDAERSAQSGGFEHLGTVQSDATKLPTKGFVIHEAGKHSHTIESAYTHLARTDLHTAEQKWPEQISVLPGVVHVGFGGQATGRGKQSSGAHTHSASTDPGHTHEISGGDLETRPKNVNVLYIIKARPDKDTHGDAIRALQRELADLRQRGSGTTRGIVGLVCTMIATLAFCFYCGGDSKPYTRTQ